MGLTTAFRSFFNPTDLSNATGRGLFMPGAPQNIVLVMNPLGGGGRSLKISQEIVGQFKRMRWTPVPLEAEASSYTDADVSLTALLRRRPSHNLIVLPTHPEAASRAPSIANVFRELWEVCPNSRPGLMVVGGDGTMTMAKEAGYLSVDLDIQKMVSGAQSLEEIRQKMQRAPVIIPTAAGTQCNIADMAGVHRHEKWSAFLREGILAGMTTMVAVVDTECGPVAMDISHTTAFGLMAGLIHEAEPWKYTMGFSGSARPYYVAAAKLVAEQVGAQLSPEAFPQADMPFQIQLIINDQAQEPLSAISFLTSGVTYFGDDQYFPGVPLHGGGLAVFPREIAATLLAAVESVGRGKGKRFFGTEGAGPVLFGKQILLLAQERQPPLRIGDLFQAQFQSFSGKPQSLRWQGNGDPQKSRAWGLRGRVVVPYPTLVAPHSIQSDWERRSGIT